jgi:hypothetical protein
MRRLRALAVISVLWAVIFTPVALLTCLQIGLKYHRPIPLGSVLRMVGFQAIGGAVSGAVFGLVLMIAERRRTVEKLRLGRLLAWGAIGGLVPMAFQAVSILVRFPGVWRMPGGHEIFATAFGYGLVEGMVASGVTLAIARRGRPSIAAAQPESLFAG